ncbi:MAG: hypothetical protein Q7R56_01970 [Nanoarchaeota archaeon]|nr:hypothetical protein [Nanoarchaeota archaeon]
MKSTSRDKKTERTSQSHPPHTLLEAKKHLLAIKKAYNLNFDELKELIEEEQTKETLLTIPETIFSKKHTILEAIVLYLHQEKKLSLSAIGKILKRDPRNLWHTYHTAKKTSLPKPTRPARYWIPATTFSHYSALEAIVVYLKEQQLTYHEIAVILARDDRTIWTVYRRAKKKQ